MLWRFIKQSIKARLTVSRGKSTICFDQFQLLLTVLERFQNQYTSVSVNQRKSLMRVEKLWLFGLVVVEWRKEKGRRYSAHISLYSYGIKFACLENMGLCILGIDEYSLITTFLSFTIIVALKTILDCFKKNKRMKLYNIIKRKQKGYE